MARPFQSMAVASRLNSALLMQLVEHIIDGAATNSDQWIDCMEPATGLVMGQVAAGDHHDVEQAVAAATRAAPLWSSMGANGRAARLHALADRVEDQLEVFARAESIDTGKPITLARQVDIPRAVANLRWFADAASGQSASEIYTTARATSEVIRVPVGVVGVIAPWNLPLYLLTWKIAAPLAMGNAVVAKPSELTPTTASMLALAASEVGFPPGVLNIVHGTGPSAGAPLVAHPDVPAITFTGGTDTGRLVNSACAELFKKVALEMGGKNPTVIFADADIDAAINTASAAAFSNQGQICLCGERLLIEASVHDRVVEGLVERAKALTIGDPLDDDTRQGSLISADHCNRVGRAVEGALKRGATCLTGGCRPDNLPERVQGGAFYRPTVLAGLDMRDQFNTSEVFGPVVCAMPFQDEAHAIELANATRYGLSAVVCTGDEARAHRMGHAIQTGTVWINCWLERDFRVPFGGVKDSGLGREGGEEAMHFATEARTICTASASSVDATGAVPREASS
ncbi:MAG: aldehyde dehydrogenase [Phycisphaerales bacterium]|nr:aldehyde dehydrogenase [Phycisphaerales bacterium]